MLTLIVSLLINGYVDDITVMFSDTAAKTRSGTWRFTVEKFILVLYVLLEAFWYFIGTIKKRDCRDYIHEKYEIFIVNTYLNIQLSWTCHKYWKWFYR